MAWGRAAVEVVEVARTRNALIAAGMSTVVDGTNADLNDPIASALDLFGVQAMDRSNVADADLNQVLPDQQSRFLDYCELRVLDTVRTQIVSRPQRQQWEDYVADYGTNYLAQIEQIIKDKTAAYLARYVNSAAPAIAQMVVSSTNQFDTAPYFPPFIATRPRFNGPLF